MEYKQRLEDLIFSLLLASIPIILFIGLFAISTTGLAAPTVDIEVELERTDGIISEIEGELPGNPPSAVTEQLAVARDMQSDAHSAFDRGEFMLALHMTMQAREVARRAQAILENIMPHGPEVPEALLRLLEGNAELIEELAPAIDEFGGEVTRSSFSVAVNLQNEAWSAFEAEDFEIAGKLARKSRDMLVQVRMTISGGEHDFDPERIAAEMDRAAELLFRADEKVPSGALEAVALLETAHDMFVESERLLAQGRPQEALRMLEEVIALSRRAVRLSEKRSLHSAELVETLSRTGDYIEATSEKVELSGRGDAIQIIEQAHEIQHRARTALDAAENVQAERLTLEARRMADLALRTAQDNPELDADAIRGVTDQLSEILSGEL